MPIWASPVELGVAPGAAAGAEFSLQAQRLSRRKGIKKGRVIGRRLQVADPGLAPPGRRGERITPATRPAGLEFPPEALGGWCLLRSSKPLSGAGSGVGVGSIPMRFRHSPPYAFPRSRTWLAVAGSPPDLPYTLN